VGRSVGIYVRVGCRVGDIVAGGQISASSVVQDREEARHSVAPQHAKGVGAVQAVHEEVSLRSAGPAQWSPAQSRVPVPS